MSQTTRRSTLERSPCAPPPRTPILRRAFVLSLSIAVALAVAATTTPAGADTALATGGLYLQSGSGHQQGPFAGAVNVNTLLGADRFYAAGFNGANAVMANIEAGHIWNGHETLAHVGLIPTSGSAAGEFDRHATWVAMVMGGRQGGADPGPYQQGMAPDAQLFSGAIATSWPANNASFPRYTASFNFSPFGISTYGPYRAAFVTGLPTADGLRTADVVNSSFVASAFGSGLSGTDQLAAVLDALANENPRTLLVLAAGNTLPSGEGPNRVPSPASGYNGLTVAALTPNGGAFDLPSSFSNGGPSNYADPVSGVVSAVRQVIDIAAPGENFSMAYYGGETGGNGPNVFGPAGGPAGGVDWYSRNVSGTSFSAPTVAGGAALLYDAAHAVLASTPTARDARVMKSVLMNSADKTLDWDNGQAAHPNAGGGVLTTQGLDDRVGAGRMNLGKAFDQLLSGTTDVPGTDQGFLGAVQTIGWDFGLVAEGITNDYLIGDVLRGGSTFTATLNWFRNVGTLGTTSFVDQSMHNLDLELWSAVGAMPLELIAESRSIYNTVEHFSFAIPGSGEYMLRVRWSSELFNLVDDAAGTFYGLAWAGVAVPEPAAALLLAVGIVILAMTCRRPSQAVFP